MIRIKSAIFAAIASLLIYGASSGAPSASADKWEFRKQTGSNNCVVQLSTSLPKLGDLISEHDTRKAACEAARDRYDKTLEDQSKCWVYGPGTISGCAADGITLPPL